MPGGLDDYWQSGEYRPPLIDKEGVYEKFSVARMDGSSEPGGKHEHCRYFVLDLAHDPHARRALDAYARSCRHDYPTLADDLEHLTETEAFGSSVKGDRRF